MRPDEWYPGWVTGRLRRVAVVAGVALLAVGVVAAVAVFVFGVGAEPACGCPPGPEFEADTVATNGTTAVRLTHAGGETLRADRLSVVVGDRRASWAERAGRPADASVRAGDSLTVEPVDPGTTVRLVYRTGEGSAVTLAEHVAGTD